MILSFLLILIFSTSAYSIDENFLKAKNHGSDCPFASAPVAVFNWKDNHCYPPCTCGALDEYLSQGGGNNQSGTTGDKKSGPTFINSNPLAFIRPIFDGIVSGFNFWLAIIVIIVVLTILIKLLKKNRGDI